jgi:NADH-quinone oxidoreductase subunit E
VNSLLAKYPDEIQGILAKYPADQKRAAVMPMLYLAQREHGYVNRTDLQEIGEILDISSTDVGSIVGFYTLYHDHPEGQHRIQVCNDLPCALRGADQFLENLCENLGIQVGGTTADGLVTVEGVMCLAACDKAPMYQVQDSAGIRYFENQTVETTLQLVEHWRSDGATPAPSPVGKQSQPVAAQPAVEPQASASPDVAVLPASPDEPADILSPAAAEPDLSPDPAPPGPESTAPVEPQTPIDEMKEADA